MIESLIQDRGLKAVKVAGTHGGEWACPCPACGGKDRFRFWPAQGEGGTWYCRQCDKGGDSIQFLREFEGLSYTEACRRLGVERAAAPTSIMPRADKAERPWEPSPTPADPGPVWQEHAAKLLDYAHARLLADEDRMMWLAMRGIFPDAVERFRLGWLPGEKGKDCYHRDRGAWGLPPETNARGRKKSLWIPAGLVVPALTEDGAVRRLRIRRTDEARERFGAEMKYVVVPGSSMRPLLLRPEARAFVVVEAELDAMACVAAAMDAGLDVGAFAAGTNMGRPDAAAHAVLRRALCILVALDFDQPDEKGQRAGAKGMPFWARTYRTARRWPVPKGKDPGDAFREGWNLADWIRIGLPPVFAPAPVQEAPAPLPVAPAPEKKQARETMGAGRMDDKGGGEKGNVSLVSFDGQYKVTRAMQDNITFDERLGVAQAIISEVLRDLTDGSSSDLRALVESAFQVNKDGQVSAARILGLRRVKISHPRWADAMRALSDSIQPLYSKAFVRIHKRDKDGAWQPIPLDIAKA